MFSVPAADLEHILAQTSDIWRALSGKRLFITGGTGFFGIWLLEAIAAANDRLSVEVSATVLSRNPARFADRMPLLAARPEFHWLQGDAADFPFPAERFDYVVHLATASAAEVGAGDTPLILRTLAGTARVLDFARCAGVRRFLLASSGAVYGAQPAQLERIAEHHAEAPDPSKPMSAYGEIKRMSELMCACTPGIEYVVARAFSFLGPGLPLTDKFAVGSFIRDALSGGPIRIHGDGSPIRSYLYAADLVIWLLTLLLKARPGRPYNVGSDQAISLAELAQEIAAITGVTVEAARAATPGSTQRYVPDISRARRELNLDVRIELSDAIVRTCAWECLVRDNSTSQIVETAR